MQTIESALHIASAVSPAVQSSDTHSHHPRSPSAHSSDDGADEDDGSTGKAAAATANPINEINATIDSLAGFKTGPRQSIMEMNDYGAPDVLRRGVLTPTECQQLFDLCVYPPSLAAPYLTDSTTESRARTLVPTDTASSRRSIRGS